MANAANTQHEPTMEEILASIRKIISEDAPEATAEAAAPPPPPPPPPLASAPAAMAEMDVLELTEEIPDEKPAAHAPPPELADDVIFEPIEEPAMPPAHDDDNEGIFSDKTRAATDDTFANIDVPEEAPVRVAPSIAQLPPLPPMDSSSIAVVFEHAVRHSFEPVLREWLGDNADVVVERMKPLIREWMDEHFPPLVENAVRNEVARAVKARSKR